MDIDKIIEANGNIYRTHFPDLDVSFSYRLLSLKEYKVFRSLRDGGVLNSYVLAEQIFSRCYFGNSAMLSDELPAGITASVGSLIMYLSGDCDQETLVQDLHDARILHPADTVFEYMRSAIITAFPTYQLEDLECLSRTQYLRLFTIAENIISKQNPDYERLDLSKIQNAEDSQRPQNQNIDFARENAAIQKAVGYWNSEDAEKTYRAEEKAKLSRQQLRKLDARG
ncbi:MAG: hypothetical protein CMF69_00245 [Magnetovibrio sp.]|nr:hypothetical protein [Magnetovibrio sp.]|tara:strand:- start:127 stop:804 length:678 start_codon:yes stop_codon:yes gene_type:complete